LLFSVPEGLTQMQVFVLVTIVSIVLRLSYSAYALPHAALGAELSTDYRERSSVAAYRLMFNSLGAFIPVVLGYSVFLTGPKGLLDRAAYVPFAWTCAAILLAIGLFCAAATFPLRHRLFIAPETPQLGRALLRDIAAIARNRTAQVLFGTVLAFNIAQGVVLNLNIHANKYFWELSDHGLKLVGISHPFGLVAGIFIGAWVAQRFEKKAIVMTGLTIMCLFEAAMPLARLAGLIPRDEGVVLAVMIPGHFLQFCAYSAMFVSFNSMIADAADEHELKHGVRREGLFFAGVAFAVKSAAGFGGLWAGLVLDLIGFPEKVASTGVGETVAFRLGLAAGPVAAALTMVCVALMTLYRLDACRHADIVAAIAARKTPITEIA
jgi:GPH family glycoside/pentoside/hexuronide:cation symporter